MSNGLAAAVDTLDDDPGLSLAIITGAGGSFCAAWISRHSHAARTCWRRGEAGFTSVHQPPIIAAVEGFALAGGTELAPQTDLIVTADNLGLRYPEVKRELVAGARACCGCLSVPAQIAVGWH